MNEFMTDGSVRHQRNYFHIFLVFLYILTAAVYAYLLYDGLDFYTTDFAQRPRMEAYRDLRPAGYRGHGFGVIGSLLMVLMLLYSVRKRSRLFQKFLPLSYWLNIHILFGIVGPMLIILHTTFKVGGLVAVSFWSMIAVALSGVLGRYLYLQIPRTISGNELSIRDVETRNAEMSRTLAEKYKMRPEALEKIEAVALGKSGKTQNIFSLLFTLLFLDLLRPFRFYLLKKQLKQEYSLPAPALREMMGIARQKAILNRKIHLWSRIHQLFHYWHIIHKPFAFIMYIIMLIHILVAVLIGYTWIF